MGLGSVVQWQTKDVLPQSIPFVLTPGVASLKEGHLIEAAVAHYYSTGSERFLKMMMKFADYIEERFCIKKNTAFKTPGHEEIELALVRLWEATGEERYLKLSKH